jgi:hypothetical protein
MGRHALDLEERILHRKVVQKRYHESKKGKEKLKEAIGRYRTSDAYKEYKRKYMRDYTQKKRDQALEKNKKINQKNKKVKLIVDRDQ